MRVPPHITWGQCYDHDFRRFSPILGDNIGVTIQLLQKRRHLNTFLKEKKTSFSNLEDGFIGFADNGRPRPVLVFRAAFFLGLGGNPTVLVSTVAVAVAMASFYKSNETQSD
jgi:hypothetical protein